MSLQQRHSLSVHLLTTHPHEMGACERLQTYARLDATGVHTITDDPEEADLILFVESFGAEKFLNAMRRHPLVHRYPHKCFCFCELDHQVSFLPGIYTSVQKRWHSRAREVGGFYLAMYDNPFVTYSPPQPEARFLFSFVGDATTHPVRDALLQIRHPRAKLVDTGKYCWKVRHMGSAEQKRAFEEDYATALRESLFVLCPRGWSPSSVRLFETLKAGRVPVIISDEWTPPSGPDWDQCSVRVPEANIAAIPSLLKALEPHAPDMGRHAREIYDRWFAPDVCFHRIVEWCREIDRARSPLERRFPRVWPLCQIVLIGRTAPFLKDIARNWRDSIRERFPKKAAERELRFANHLDSKGIS